MIKLLNYSENLMMELRYGKNIKKKKGKLQESIDKFKVWLCSRKLNKNIYYRIWNINKSPKNVKWLKDILIVITK